MARILLVEDSPTQAIMLRALLAEDGHQVDVASDGLVAVQKTGEQAFDVIVTDMQMPNMNGLELVRCVRQQHPQLPVVLITGQGSEVLAAQALKEGAAAYLPKSLMDEQLLDSIDRVLGLMSKEMSYRDLIEYLDYNEFQFTLVNDPAMVAPLVHLMQQVATSLHLSDDVVRARIGMAVQQAVLNAIYRGNLEISRQQQIDDEEILLEGEASLLDQRRNQLPYSQRRVHFRAKLGLTELKFIIGDDGNGFDTSTVPSPTEAQQRNSDTGRGLVLIQSFMDEVRFNEKGNEITMVKRIQSAH